MTIDFCKEIGMHTCINKMRIITVYLCNTEMSTQPGLQAGDSQHVWSEFGGEHGIANWNYTGRVAKPCSLVLIHVTRMYKIRNSVL